MRRSFRIHKEVHQPPERIPHIEPPHPSRRDRKKLVDGEAAGDGTAVYRLESINLDPELEGSKSLR